MLGSPILYLNGMRTIMFQLSGFYCRASGDWTGSSYDRFGGPLYHRVFVILFVSSQQAR